MSSENTSPPPETQGELYFGDNLDIVGSLDDESVDLIYLDPPFNSDRHRSPQWARIPRTNDGRGDRDAYSIPALFFFYSGSRDACDRLFPETPESVRRI